MVNKKKDIGRNDPCWCGSGKKYKKCHLRRDEEAERAELEQRDRFDRFEELMRQQRERVGRRSLAQQESNEAQAQLRTTCEFISGRHVIHGSGDEEFCLSAGRQRVPSPRRARARGSSAYHMACLAESVQGSLHVAEDVQHRLAAWPYSISKLRGWSTDRLVEELGAVGVDIDRERFLEKADRYISAWVLAENWIDEGRVYPHLGEDLIYLGACELWRRWLPERPSVEMFYDILEDRPHGSYDQAEHDRWVGFWRAIDELLPESIDTSEDADVYLGIRMMLFNWTQDVTIECAHNSPEEFLEQAIPHIERMIERFSGESHEWRAPMRGDLAQMLMKVGRDGEAIAIFEDLIEHEPESVRGYVLWADSLEQRGEVTSLRRALELLEGALASEATDGADWDVASRRDDVKAKLDEFDAPSS